MRVDAPERVGFWRSSLRAVANALQAYRRRARPDPCAERQAAERSRELLVACLTPAQRAEFARRHAFTVRGSSGKRYRIAFGTTANVEVLGERGEVEHRLCAGPTRLSTCAVMLAQKLMLESRESEFLRIAVRHPAIGQFPGEGRSAADVLRVA